MVIDCSSSLRSSSTQSGPGASSSSGSVCRPSTLGFAVVPRSGTSLEELMTPRLRPVPPTSGQSSSSLQLVLEDEDSYTFVENDMSPVGGALVHKEDVMSVQDVIDHLAEKESGSAHRQRQSSVVSWASTTVEAVHGLPRYDSYSPSSLTPSPRDRTILPPAEDDASHSPTPASSASRAISLSTSRLERSSPAPVSSAWSGRDESSGDDIDCDVVLDDASSPKVASASKTLWHGARPHRPETKSQPPPRNKAKSSSSHIRKAKSKARSRAAPRPASTAASRTFKCRYIDPVTDVACGAGKCIKLYDLVRHMMIHVNEEIKYIDDKLLVHHPDGAPFAEDEQPAPLLSALVPELKWEHLQNMGLSQQYEFRAEKVLHEVAMIHQCYDPLCPASPGEFRKFPRKDTLAKHLRDQHRGRTKGENDAMQPPDAVTIDRRKLEVIFGREHAARLLGISDSSRPDDADAMDVAPSASEARSAEPYVKSENVSPQVPLLQLESAPSPRVPSAHPQSPPRSRRARKRVSFADSPTYATPVLASDRASTSSSPIIQTPALLATPLVTHHIKSRNMGTPEAFSSPLPRSPLCVSTLPPPLEEDAVQAHLSIPFDSSRPPSGLLFSGVGSDPRSPLIYSPGLPSPAVLANSPLPNYSNLSPASAMLPQTLSPHSGGSAVLQPLASGLTPDVHGLHLELGQFQDPSYAPSPQYGTSTLAQQTPPAAPDWFALWAWQQQQHPRPPPPVLRSNNPNICLYVGPSSADPSPRSAYEQVPSPFSSGDPPNSGATAMNETDPPFQHFFAGQDMDFSGIDVSEESPYGCWSTLPSPLEDIVESTTV